jgi:hypothetical protein
MFRRHHLALVGAAALALAPGIATAQTSVTDGFLLTGTDAAYTRFVAQVDECHSLDLFVGYVDAERLLNPLGSGRPQHHSDVEAVLTVSEHAETEGCGSDVLQLTGVRGVTEADQAEIVTLETASLDDFALTVDGFEGEEAVSVALTLSVSWTGDGDVFTETLHSPGDHTAHRTVAAAVDATVTIDSVTGGGELASALSAIAGSPISGLEQTEGVITRFQQIIINVP